MRIRIAAIASAVAVGIVFALCYALSQSDAPPSVHAPRMATASTTLKTGNIVASGTITISLGGGATWTVGSTAPSGACSTGSFYSVTSGSNGFYVCNAGSWVAGGGGGGGGITNAAAAGVVPVSDGTNLVASPLSVVGGILHLNPNQNVINIDGILWSNGDSRTSGNLEAGSDLGDPVAGTDCNGTGCAALSSRVRFSNTNHQALYSIATAEADEGSGSSATNTNIEIDASGPSGAVIINGAGAGSNGGGGGMAVRHGQNSTTNEWSVDSAGDTSQLGSLTIAGNGTIGGALTLSSSFADINGIIYANSDTVMLEPHGLACDYNTNGAATCFWSGVGYADSTSQPRDNEIDDGQGTGASHLALHTVASTHGAYTGTGGIGVSGASGPTWKSGTGAPSGACVVGSLYTNVSGGTSTTLYVCTASATWTAK